MAKTELTVRCFISIGGAEPALLSELPPERLEYARRKMAENLSAGMSLYYAAHPEEYAAVPEL